MKKLATAAVFVLLLLGWQFQYHLQARSLKVDQQRLQKLIADLGSASFAEREQAARQLEAAGMLALEPLRAALKNPDAEISGRAARLLAALERQALTNRMLAGKKVHLNLKDVAVADAVAELAKQSSYRLETIGNLTLLRERKITHDTGEVTYWEALRQLCRKGGLLEVQTSFSPQPSYYRKGGDQPGYAPAIPPLSSSIVLSDGQGKEVPVCLQGSLRIKALPLDRPGPGEMQLLLDVDVETRLKEFSIVGTPFFSKIVDEHGETLALAGPKAAAAFTNTARFGGFGNVNGLAMIDGNLEQQGGNPSLASQHGVAVRIRLGEKGAKTLKEISGTLCVQALNDPEVLVKVDGVLQAAGRSFEGKDGNIIHMQAVEKMDDGSYQIRLSVESPAMQQQDPFAARNMRVGKGRWKAANIELPYGAHVSPPTLLDAAGKEYVAEVAGQSVGFNQVRQVVQNFVLIYRPTDPALKNPWPAAPAQLLLQGQRVVQFSVPFTLKNVPVQ